MPVSDPRKTCRECIKRSQNATLIFSLVEIGAFYVFMVWTRVRALSQFKNVKPKILLLPLQHINVRVFKFGKYICIIFQREKYI